MIFSFNHKVHVNLKYHSVTPLVRIGTPPSSARECVPPGTKGGHTRLRVRGLTWPQFGRLEKKPGCDLTQETTKNKTKEKIYSLYWIYL
jgi:hypothetical protein